MTKPVPLMGGYFYHIYNRGNNKETIFRTGENFRYFLQLYAQHVEPIAVTYAFCLLPNHFHLLDYIRTDEEQRSWLLAQGCQLSESWHPLPPHLAFKNLFIAYSMAFNLRYERTGSLFQKPFKRILVDSDRYFTALVRYIHRNPQKHGLSTDFREWAWSSYGTILAERATRIPRADVLERFGGRDYFITLHAAELDERPIAELITE
jgi:REP element-mobilizing transposase RayT